MSQLPSRRRGRNRLTLIWGGLAVMLAAIVVWAAVQDADPLSAYVPVDKVRHILAFGALGLCAAFLPSARTRIGALGLVLAFALAVEVMQIPIPDRRASFSDLAASLVGAFAGFGAGAAATSAFALVRGWISRRQLAALRRSTTSAPPRP